MRPERTRVPSSLALAASSQAKAKEAAVSSSRPRPRPTARGKAAAKSKKSAVEPLQEQDEEAAAAAAAAAAETNNDVFEETPTEESSSEEDNSADEDFDGEGSKSKKAIGKSQNGSQAIAQGKAGKGMGKGKKEKLMLPSRFSDEDLSMNTDDIIASQQRMKDAIKSIDQRSQTPESPRRFRKSGLPEFAEQLDDCPFCSKPMPAIPSERLVRMMQHWLDLLNKGEVRINSSTDTLELCYRHLEESEIIPAGEDRGWIRELDVDELVSRIQREPHYLKRMRDRIDKPEGSDWFSKLKEMRALHGRRMDGVMAQMNGMADMQAGYYGELGWEAMRGTLVDEFIRAKPGAKYNLNELAGQPDGLFRPLSAQDFIDKVLLPELVCMLIQDDESRRSRRKKVSLIDAKRIRDASHKYGMAKFPSLGSVSWPGDESMMTNVEERPSSSKDASQQLTAAASSSKMHARRQRRTSEGLRTVTDVNYDERSDDGDGSTESSIMRTQRKAKKARTERARQPRLSPNNERPKQAVSADPSISSPSRPRPRPSAGRDSAVPSSSLTRSYESGDKISIWIAGGDVDVDDENAFTKHKGRISSPSVQTLSSQALLSAEANTKEAGSSSVAAPSRQSMRSSQDDTLQRAASSDESGPSWFTVEEKASSIRASSRLHSSR